MSLLARNLAVPNDPDGTASTQDVRHLAKGLQDLASQDLASQAGRGLDDETLQSLIGAALGIYVQRFDAGNRSPIVRPDAKLNATAVLIVATMLMKSENIEVFELGMWQTFSGIK